MLEHEMAAAKKTPTSKAEVKKAPIAKQAGAAAMLDGALQQEAKKRKAQKKVTGDWDTTMKTIKSLEVRTMKYRPLVCPELRYSAESHISAEICDCW